MFQRTRRSRDEALRMTRDVIRYLVDVRARASQLQGVGSEACVRALDAVVDDYRRLERELSGLL